MPEFGELIGSSLRGVIGELDRSEQRHLLAHVKAVKEFAGQTPGIDEIQALIESGWLPDFYAASKVQLDASLSLTTSRERTSGGSGGVEFGPIKITGTFANSFSQGTVSNVTVSLELARGSRDRALNSIFEVFSRTPQVP